MERLERKSFPLPTNSSSGDAFTIYERVVFPVPLYRHRRLSVCADRATTDRTRGVSPPLEGARPSPRAGTEKAHKAATSLITGEGREKLIFLWTSPFYDVRVEQHHGGIGRQDHPQALALKDVSQVCQRRPPLRGGAQGGIEKEAVVSSGIIGPAIGHRGRPGQRATRKSPIH